MTYSVYLQVKVNSLADEFRRIRVQSQRWRAKGEHVVLKAEAFAEGVTLKEARTAANCLEKLYKKGLDTKAERLRKRLIRAKARQSQEYQDCRDRRLGLDNHRRFIVRPACRSAHLALGFLRGVPYRAMEATCHANSNPEWKMVWDLVERYGDKIDVRVARQRFAEWLDAANLGYKITFDGNRLQSARLPSQVSLPTSEAVQVSLYKRIMRNVGLA